MMRIFQTRRSDRGSALILVILLTLILSAFAIVALRNVSRSVQQTALFQTRAQAQSTSSSAVNLYTQRAGDKASTIVYAIKSQSLSAAGGQQGVYGGSANAAERLATATAGGHLRVDDDFLVNLIPQATAVTSNGKEQTGLFTNSAGSRRTFEDSRSSKFEVIVRDLVDGIPAPGYSGRYCFKKALIASDARVGERDDDWSSANNVAYARHGKEVLLGPIECGFE
jgi:Tfp pilus assembly protein PilX